MMCQTIAPEEICPNPKTNPYPTPNPNIFSSGAIVRIPKKIFHIKIMLHTKIMWDTKNYAVPTKEIMSHPKKRLLSTKNV